MAEKRIFTPSRAARRPRLAVFFGDFSAMDRGFEAANLQVGGSALVRERHVAYAPQIAG